MEPKILTWGGWIIAGQGFAAISPEGEDSEQARLWISLWEIQGAWRGQRCPQRRFRRAKRKRLYKSFD
jgi:hypothetical protein